MSEERENDTPQAKGGRARAQKMSPEDRREVAKAGAAARWRIHEPDGSQPIHQAIAVGDLQIGEITIPCAVLDDGTRVVSMRGMGRALGRGHGGKDWRSATEGGGQLPFFMVANSLKPFIENDLELVGFEPIIYSGGGSRTGGTAHGIRAELIPHFCDVWLKAREAGKLNKAQEAVAQRAELLMRGLAHAGIIALVDDATGYTKYRARDELQKILSAYISPELLPWAKRFPDSFYEHLHRVRGWKYAPGSSARTAYIGKLTNALIYEQLPPGVLDELRKKNPRDPVTKRRKHTHHEILTPEIGHPHLEKQIFAVTTLLSVSDSWSEFSKLFSRKFPPGPGDLFTLPPPKDD